MKKLNSFFIVLLVVGLMLFPKSGSARMEALTETELSQVTGHGGFSVQVDELGLDLSIDTIAFGDEDGFGKHGKAGYLSFCDVTLKGLVKWASPPTIDIVTSGKGSNKCYGLNIAMNDMTVEIDEFTIGAVKLGSAPGTGNSFGSITITDMTVNMTGNIQIGVHL